ncbi:MAG TPA: hypothetical protein VMU76_12400 [Acidimicrobiales bacterium]|nr:hypothetical protein [Acidimicrobiales bacterium]
MSPPGDRFSSYPASRVANSQPAGIGRVAALGERAAWNNLGRNIVFSDRGLRPRAVFDDTLYPDDDELSQYDLDIHAIVALPGADLVLALNHLGLVRAFDGSEIPDRGPVHRLRPLWTRAFAEDVERAVIVGNRLVGSGSRSGATTGIVVSEHLFGSAPGGPMETRAELGTWGEVTALAPIEHDGETSIAVGGAGRVSLVPLAGGRPGPSRWDVPVPFRTAGFAWDAGLLWAAGSALVDGIDDHDWENVRGGGVVALRPTDGRVVASAPFPDDVAWGNGGSAFAVLGGVPCAVARTGELCVARGDLRAHSAEVSVATGDPPTTAGDREAFWVRTPPVASGSLGIAHAAVVANRLLYGFNRGDYRLQEVPGSDIRPLTGSER